MLAANAGKTLRLDKLGSSLGACVLDKSACVLGTSIQAFGRGQLGLEPKSGSWAQPSFVGKPGGE